MLTISSLAEVQAYRALTALNQSELKKIEHGLAHYRFIKENPTPQSEGMVLGSIVDTLLLGTPGDEHELFHAIPDSALPTESIQILVREIASLSPKGVDDINDSIDIVRDVVLRSSWQANWKEETRIAKVLEQGASYFKELMRGRGKTIISEEQYMRACSAVGGLFGNPVTRELFDRNFWERQESVDVTYQKPLEFEWEGIRCKALIDIWIERKSKQGLEIVICDLKTTSSLASKFPEAVKRYRYDLQIAFYRLAAVQALGIDPRDVTCKFVVESTTEPGSPRLYTCSREFMQDAESSLLNLLREWKGYAENGFQTEHIEQVLQML